MNHLSGEPPPPDLPEPMQLPVAPDDRPPPPPPAPPEPVRLPVAPPDLPLHASRPVVPRLRVEAGGIGQVLRQRDFRLLWIAQALSQLADKFLVFTLLVVVYDLSRSASTQSILLIAYTLPSVFLSAPAGVYADRHDKRHLMFATNMIRAVLIALIPLVENLPGLGHHALPLIVITFLFSSVGQIFAPAEAASIPSLVRRDQIMEAMSLFMSTVIITLVLGVPAATLCIRLLGASAPFFLAATGFALAAASVWAIGTNLRALPARVARAGGSGLSQVWQELHEGLVILGANRALRLALVQLTVALIVVFTVFALGPPYLATVLKRSPEDTYLLLLPATIGLIGMAASLGSVDRRVSRAFLMVVAFAVAGACLVFLGVVPHLLETAGLASLSVVLAVVPATLFGCALGTVLIPAFTVLQERTTEETRGRIFGSIFTVINAAVALPLLLAGGLADTFGVGVVVAGLGVTLIGLGLVARTGLWRHLSILDADRVVEPATDGPDRHGPAVMS